MWPTINKFRHFVLYLGIIFSLGQCKKTEISSEIPQIEFKSAGFLKSLDGKDSMLVITITYKDGDGDLGLNQTDTFAPFNPVTDSLGKSLNPYYQNLHINYFEKYEGIFSVVTNPFNVSDTLAYAFRFESLTPEGRHKSIRGDIEVKISPNAYPTAQDTTMYEVYIYDRALHKSNLVKSPAIIWNR